MTGRAVANCLMISAGTGSRWGAGDCFTDFDADAVESIANFFSGAVVVALTADRDANDGGIALHTSRAVALRTMESDTAQGVGSALIATENARIQTFAGDASAVRRAVVISFTFSCCKDLITLIAIIDFHKSVNLRRKHLC